ncbi:hypothetical protein XOC_2224 [Xanthomonas oryzae pv. oryzicola BLS256]|uniref:Uncharacterized protein n=1 Tax=Xanthomonas oryzae pv. oryzicola (strain BLS256) TaxID=383407 RepID=G7TE36_XANOB|nr:hypothetical protein XOC_2224 [Xanthomonas oryzae pv. oryzicola BLS256]
MPETTLSWSTARQDNPGSRQTIAPDAAVAFRRFFALSSAVECVAAASQR